MAEPAPGNGPNGGVAVTTPLGSLKASGPSVLLILGFSVVAGAVLCWARALGEFGATITFAGNLEGRTQTLPLAVYQARQTDPGGAIFLSLILVVISIVVLVAMRDHLMKAR